MTFSNKQPLRIPLIDRFMIRVHKSCLRKKSPPKKIFKLVRKRFSWWKSWLYLKPYMANFQLLLKKCLITFLRQPKKHLVCHCGGLLSRVIYTFPDRRNCNFKHRVTDLTKDRKLAFIFLLFDSLEAAVIWDNRGQGLRSQYRKSNFFFKEKYSALCAVLLVRANLVRRS